MREAMDDKIRLHRAEAAVSDVVTQAERVLATGPKPISIRLPM